MGNCPVCGHPNHKHVRAVGSMVSGLQPAVCTYCGCTAQRCEFLCADSRCHGCTLKPAVGSGHYPKNNAVTSELE
jgi:hypothetical protein